MSEFDFTDAVKRTIAEQHDKIAALEAENARLRELVRGLLSGLRMRAWQAVRRVLVGRAWRPAYLRLSRTREGTRAGSGGGSCWLS